MNRHRISRIATASSVIALLASMMLAGGALAANNRDVYFGSPTSAGGTGGTTTGATITYGTLAGETKVTEGGRTAVTVLIENEDNQTLNHVRFSGGTNADLKPDNATNTTPTGTSLPAGASIAAVFSTSNSTSCTALPASGVDCELGQLAAGGAVTLTVVINAPAAKGDYAYWLTGSWSEGWSTTGTNADYNFATGTIKVLEKSCGNGQANYFLGTESLDLSDGSTGSCNDQDAKLASGQALGGNGGHATLSIDNSFAATCPSALKCFGKTVDASVIGGNSVPGGLQWTLTFYGTKTLKGVVHFATSGTTSIPLTSKFLCSTKLTTDCWVSVKTSKGNVTPAWVEVVFITDGNGKAGGWA